MAKLRSQACFVDSSDEHQVAFKGDEEAGCLEICVISSAAVLCAMGATSVAYCVSAVVAGYMPPLNNTDYIDIESLVGRSVDRRFQPCDNFYRYTCEGFKRDYPTRDFFTIPTVSMLHSILTVSLDTYYKQGSIIAYGGILLYRCVRENYNMFEENGGNFIFKIIETTPERLASEKTTAEAVIKLSLLLGLRLSIPSLLPVSVTYNFLKDLGSIVCVGFLGGNIMPLKSWSSTIDKDNNALSACTYYATSLMSTKTDLFSRVVSSCVTYTEIWNEKRYIYRDMNSDTFENSDDVSHQYVTLDELASSSSILTTTQWVNSLRLAAPPSIRHLINESYQVLLTNVVYLSIVETMVQEHEDFESRLNLLYFIIIASLPSLNWFYKSFSILPWSQKKRIGQCISYVVSLCSPVFALFHIRRLMPRRDQLLSAANDVTTDICRSFEFYITNNSWMDASTKLNALRRLNNLKRYIRSPLDVASLERLQRSFKMFSVSAVESGSVPSAFLRQVSEMNRWEMELFFVNNASPNMELFDRGYLKYKSLSVNAFYAPFFHIFTILAPLLQRPFFELSMNTVFVFSVLGKIVAHEISHAFDSDESNAGKDGLTDHWMSSVSLQNALKKFECVRQLYNDAPWVGLKTRKFGDAQLNENIADLLGNAVAWHAFQQRLKNSSRNIRPTHVLLKNFTLFEAFAVFNCFMWCGHRNEGTFAAGNVHSPSMLRCNMPLAAMEQFSKTFNCSEATRAGKLRNKCSIFN